MKKTSYLFVVAMLLFQPVIGFASEDIAEEQKENGTPTQQFDKIGMTPTYPMNNADGTVQFLDQTWDVIKDYGDNVKMIAMQNKIADSQFNPTFYFNTNNDGSTGYQDSIVKSIVDGWYNDTIAGTDYEQFVKPVSLSNPTLGTMKGLGWQSNEVGKITTDVWKQEIIDPSKYPTIVGSGEKQAFLMSGSDVSVDDFASLSQAVKAYQEKLLEKNINSLWLRSPGVASNNVSYLHTIPEQVTVVLSTVDYTRSVVPSLVVQSYDKAASVIVKYQDEKGNSLSDDVILDGVVGLPYQSTAASISGWILKETPANAAGTFTEIAQEVVYVYEKEEAEAAPVTVKYQDEEGNQLSADVVLNGKVGLPYQSTVASISGWTLKETPANAAGTFTEIAQEVVYVYEKEEVEAAPVTVKYQDEEGNQLSADVVLNGKVGLPYQSTATSISGWILKETPANATGTFTDKAQMVTYVYEKIESNKPITPPTGIDKGNSISSLPQTGELQSFKIWKIMGILLLGSSALVVSRRRKHQK